MDILIIGKTGQLARALADELEPMGHSAIFLDRETCDLSGTASQIRTAVAPHFDDTDVVIIAAAYTAVDQAEDDEDMAMAVNAYAPGIIAEEASKAGVPLIYLSTDYVFDGQSDTPYPTDHPVAPINAYGRSKAAGEMAVRNAQPQSAILRTSWVYDGAGKNFLTTMLRLGETRENLSIVADQIGRPTYARDLARACLVVADELAKKNPDAAGTFHVTNSGDPVSWADFARAIFCATVNERTHRVAVTDIPSSEFSTAAKRPSYSVLSLSAYVRTFAFELPDWQSGLSRALEARGELSKV